MPFITEEIYQSLPHECDSIMIDSYPEYNEALSFFADAEKMTKIIDAITAIRARRSEMNVPPSKKAKVFIETRYGDIFGAASEAFFVRLASASEICVAEKFNGEVSADNSVQIITDAATIYLPLSDIIDFEKEKARLEGEKAKMAKYQENLDNVLAALAKLN